jgi:hypothetical protein
VRMRLPGECGGRSVLPASVQARRCTQPRGTPAPAAPVRGAALLRRGQAEQGDDVGGAVVVDGLGGGGGVEARLGAVGVLADVLDVPHQVARLVDGPHRAPVQAHAPAGKAGGSSEARR